MLIQISRPDIFCPFYFSFIRHQTSGYNTHKCGFSLTICTNQTDMLALQQTKRYIFKNRTITKTMRQVFYI